jgi:hypothetical protein
MAPPSAFGVFFFLREDSSKEESASTAMAEETYRGNVLKFIP